MNLLITQKRFFKKKNKENERREGNGAKPRPVRGLPIAGPSSAPGARLPWAGRGLVGGGGGGGSSSVSKSWPCL